jgi:hypothetical protein
VTGSSNNSQPDATTPGTSQPTAVTGLLMTSDEAARNHQQQDLPDSIAFPEQLLEEDPVLPDIIDTEDATVSNFVNQI